MSAPSTREIVETTLSDLQPGKPGRRRAKHLYSFNDTEGQAVANECVAKLELLPRIDTNAFLDAIENTLRELLEPYRVL